MHRFLFIHMKRIVLSILEILPIRYNKGTGKREKGEAKMVKRYLMVNEIKPEYLEEYVKAHQTMHEGKWKEQLQVLRQAGAKECISYLYKNYSILIYECEDIDESFRKLGQIPARAAWEDFTQPMFQNSPKFDGSEKTEGLQKIFDLNQQLDEGRLNQF